MLKERKKEIGRNGGRGGGVARGHTPSLDILLRERSPWVPVVVSSRCSVARRCAGSAEPP